MLSGPRTLDELRREIDRIDDAMHDLLMQRTAVVEEIGRAKALAETNGSTQFFRPGREALILRRIVGRHEGAFPKASLVRIWREIITGQLRVQTEIAVAAYAPESQRAFWDIARDQYGSAAAYQPLHRTHHVVAAVRNGVASVGVLPMPEGDDAEPWWPLLAASDPQTPRIVSKLPFAAAGPGPAALAIACAEPEETGEDRSFLIVETDDEVSHGALANGLTVLGFAPRALLAEAGRRAGPVRLHLCEVEGAVAPDDPRARGTNERARISRIIPVGGYAVPLGRAMLDGAGPAS